MFCKARLVTSSTLALLLAQGASAQGLGALATQTEAQRKAQPSEGRTFSNDSLPGQSRIEAALRDFALTMDAYSRLSNARDWIHNHRMRNMRLNTYLANMENMGATRASMAEQAREYPEITHALDTAGLTPFTFEVTEAALERAVVDATRSEAELEAMPPTRAANARFARKNAQYLANGRYHDDQRKKTLPRPLKQ